MAKKISHREKNRPLDSDKLGQAGERRFAELCALGRLIAPDSSREDKMGWDFHVEFPHSPQRGEVAFDARTKMPDMKIQVKTIWSDRSSVDVKLTAAERLASWNYPSFIVILRMNEDLNYKDAYIIHLLGENLALILRALRKAEATGSLSIKSKTIRFGIKHGVKIAVNGAELVAALREALGSTPDDYVLNKREQWKSLGFAPRPIAISFTLKPANKTETLDFLLGLKEARVDNFHSESTRFGITIPHLPKQAATIMISPNSLGECEIVVVTSRSKKRRVSFTGELYAATITGDLHGPMKMRVISPIFELVCDSTDNTGMMNTKVPSNGLAVKDWMRLARLGCIEASDKGEIQLRKGGKHFLTLKWHKVPDQILQAVWEERLTAWIRFQEILSELDLEDILITAGDVEENFDTIQFISSAHNVKNDVVIRFKATTRDDMPTIERETAGIIGLMMVLSGCTIAFWAVANVTVSEEGELLSFCFSNPALRDVVRITADQDFDSFVDEASRETGIGMVVKINRTGSARSDESAAIGVTSMSSE